MLSRGKILVQLSQNTTKSLSKSNDNYTITGSRIEKLTSNTECKEHTVNDNSKQTLSSSIFAECHIESNISDNTTSKRPDTETPVTEQCELKTVEHIYTDASAFNYLDESGCTEKEIVVDYQDTLPVSIERLSNATVTLDNPQIENDKRNEEIDTILTEFLSNSNCDDEVLDPDWQPEKQTDTDSSTDNDEAENTENIPNEIFNTPEVGADEIALEQRVDEISNIKKENRKRRMKGLEYVGVKKGKGHVNKRPERLLAQRTCSSACQKGKGGRGCNAITEEYRKETFKAFWETMDWSAKRVYVMSLVNKVPTERSISPNSRRRNTYIYHFKVSGVNVRVCKELFLSTLGLKEDMVYGWVNKDPNNNGIPEVVNIAPRRNEKAREIAEKFLTDLPKLPSHYCRADTTKRYLETACNTFTEVYNTFVQKQLDEGINRNDICGKTLFLEIFESMNLSLFKPKKDQCDLCVGFKVGNVDQDAYCEHIKRKTDARQAKSDDKTEAEETNRLKVFTMDVQSLLLSPKLEASCLYYKTKLCCHNFTFFDLVTKNCTCYFWNETATDLSASTFVSCVIDFLESTDLDNIEKVILYSDGCAYQNRNVTLSNALSAFAKKHGIIVEQKFLERGHTQMECDSVHAHIETKLKKRDIFVPSQYVEVMENARPKQPYTVKYCDFSFFKDYTKLTQYSTIRPGIGVGSPVVADIRQLQYLPDGTIRHKTNYSGTEFESLRKPRTTSTLGLDDVPKMRSTSLPIKKTKYDHLQQIKSVIPKDYHPYYDCLPHLLT